MPRLLFRYMFTDLLRIAFLTTAILVTVIAFGAMIKPLANDRLRSAGQIVKYIILVIVPMLQYALPFAAGFAGTLSLHRMTAENEILAASVSGLSYRRLLMPVLALGGALVLIMALLTQSIIPRFWSLLERTIAEDVTKLFQASIERHEAFIIENRQIWADDWREMQNPHGEPGDTRLVLFHVAAGETDNEDRLVRDITAEQVVVDIYRRELATTVKMVMLEAVISDPVRGTLAYAPELPVEAIVIPSVTEDRLKYMSLGQLLALRDDPDRYGPVINERRQLADALSDLTLWHHVDERLRAIGQVDLVAHSPARRLAVEASRLKGGRFVNSTDDAITVTEFEADRPRRRFRTIDAQLVRNESLPTDDLRFDLILSNCEVMDLDHPDISNLRDRIPLENLSFEGFTADDFSTLGSDDLLRLVAELPEDDRQSLESRSTKLSEKHREVQDEILARLLQRAALSCTAFLLLLLGALLAMLLRETLPLVIYLWAFLPSILNIVVISGGEHLIRDGHLWGGGTIMWGGSALLLGMIIVAYRRLARN